MFPALTCSQDTLTVSLLLHGQGLREAPKPQHLQQNTAAVHRLCLPLEPCQFPPSNTQLGLKLLQMHVEMSFVLLSARSKTQPSVLLCPQSHSCSFESSTKVARGTFHLLVKVQEYTSPLGSPLISLFPHCSFQFLSHTAATRPVQSSVLSPLVFVSSSFLSCTICLETPPKAFLALWAIMAIQYWGKTATGAEEPSQHLKIISHFHKIRAD